MRFEINPNDIASGYSSIVLGGKLDDLTFVGVLRQCFYGDEHGKFVSEGWNGERTIPEYIKDYELRLVPLLPFNKALRDYTLEDYEKIINRIYMAYPSPDYSDEIRERYRFLFARVYTVGYRNGLYDDMLFLAEQGVSDSEKELTSARRIKLAKEVRLIKKSFSIEQEIELAKWFKKLDPKTADGESIGLLIMFFNGPRGNEVCGLNFADIRRTVDEYSFPCIHITKTTDVGTNRLKGGAKTSNGIRIIPTFPFLMDFIEKRKAYIQGFVDKRKLKLPSDIDSVEQLPIVCKGNDFCTRASSRDLTNAGNNLFALLGIDSKARDFMLSETLYKNKLAENDIDQREITTYLFRRNAATHYYTLGLSSVECEYLMGHFIEDFSSRSYHINGDLLYDIYRRILQHPLNLMFKYDFCDCGIDKVFSQDKDFRVVAEEPMEGVRIKVKRGRSASIVCCSSTLVPERRKTADISMMMKGVGLGKKEGSARWKDT